MVTTPRNQMGIALKETFENDSFIPDSVFNTHGLERGKPWGIQTVSGVDVITQSEVTRILTKEQTYALRHGRPETPIHLIRKRKYKQMSSLGLDGKEFFSWRRIVGWIDYWSDRTRDYKIHVSFSGGIDSTVLLHMVRKVDPDIPAVFVDTGLEFPEIQEFVKTIPNVTWLRPKKMFWDVIREDGYPVVSKKVSRYIWDLKNPTPENEVTRHLRLTGITGKGTVCKSLMLPEKWRYLVNAPFKISDRCCYHLKKEPLFKYEKEHCSVPFTAVMAAESETRTRKLIRTGCNDVSGKHPVSSPMSIWTTHDVLSYIKKYNLPYCSVYGDIVQNKNGSLTTTGESSTGCMFCGFGLPFEKGENRFQRMARTHPNQYRYCMDRLGYRQVCKFMHINVEPIIGFETYQQISLFN